MNLGKDSACLLSTFVGNVNRTSGVSERSEMNIAEATKNSNIVGGNRCGHERDNIKSPRFKPTNRSHSIKEATRILYLFFTSYGYSLSQLRPFLDKYKFIVDILFNHGFSDLLYHKKDNQRDRRIRSERVESSIALVLSVIIANVDLCTMAFGFFNYGANKQVYYDYDYIIKLTGITKRRLFRAIALLKSKGVLTVNKLVDKKSIGYKHKEIRIFLNEDIFEWLGLKEQMLLDRKYAMKRWTQHEKNRRKRQSYLESHRVVKKTDKNIHNAKEFIKGLAQKLAAPETKTRNYNVYDEPTRGQPIKALYQQLQHEGKTPKEAIDIIRKQYPPS